MYCSTSKPTLRQGTSNAATSDTKLGLVSMSTSWPARRRPTAKASSGWKSLRDAVRGRAPICANGALGLTQMPECKQGDMLEYAGMSCLAGERARCDDVKRSQGADGRFWRNPTAAAAGREEGDGKDSFSRDM